MAHVKVKELVVAAYAAAPDLPPERAELMHNTTPRLDITSIILAEAIDQDTTQTTALADLNGVNNHG